MPELWVHTRMVNHSSDPLLPIAVGLAILIKNLERITRDFALRKLSSDQLGLNFTGSGLQLSHSVFGAIAAAGVAGSAAGGEGVDEVAGPRKAG